VGFPKAHFLLNLLLRNPQHRLQLRHLKVLLSHPEALLLQAELPLLPELDQQVLSLMNLNR
jgi:hypothetical protein